MRGVVFFTVLVLLFSLNFGEVIAKTRSRSIRMGINYGRLGDDLPPPEQAVALIKSLGFGQVKIFDSDPNVLRALSNTSLRVVMAATNEELETLAASPAAAAEWLDRQVRPHLPAARIRMITVGNELLSRPEINQPRWPLLLPAMQNLQEALEAAGMRRLIKVSTCVAMDALNVSYPPSAARFRPDIADAVLRPVLQLLSSAKSYIFLNAYPYLAWSENSEDIPLDYAIFDTEATAVADGDLRYGDLLDAQVDSFVAAMEALGFPDVKVAISETGWPTAGGGDEVGASVSNAALYNGRLVQKMMTNPPKGSPRRPGVYIPTFIFALFNENQKPGPVTERNWGLLYPNASHVYPLSF